MCGRYFVDDGMSEEVKRLVCGLKKEDAGKPGNIYNAGNSETARVAGARSAYEGDAARTAGIGGIRDVCPSQQAAVLAADPNLPGTVMVKQMIWGFPGIQNKGLLINARAESALQKKTYRDSILTRRCVIPASGFYEWNPSKEKFSFERRDGGVIFMAGCYNWFGEEERFVILTTAANASAAYVHERMPVVVEANEVERWILDDSATEQILRKVPVELKSRTDYEQMTLF